MVFQYKYINNCLDIKLKKNIINSNLLDINKFGSVIYSPNSITYVIDRLPTPEAQPRAHRCDASDRTRTPSIKKQINNLHSHTAAVVTRLLLE